MPSTEIKMRWIVLFICIILFTSVGATPAVPKLTMKEKILNQVWAVAASVNDERFFHVYSSILWAESDYDHNVKINFNNDGSYDMGVAQLNSYYWDPKKLYWGYDITTPLGNARVGALFFLSLVNRYNGDYYRAVIAYNCGGGDYAKAPTSTKAYVKKVWLRALLSQAIARD